MSFQDGAFIFILGLIVFGPKKLPEIGRQIGKLVGEFRRASNEFKFQIEDELRKADEAEARKKAELAAQERLMTSSVPAETSGSLTLQPPSTGAPIAHGEAGAGALHDAAVAADSAVSAGATEPASSARHPLQPAAAEPTPPARSLQQQAAEIEPQRA